MLMFFWVSYFWSSGLSPLTFRFKIVFWNIMHGSTDVQATIARNVLTILASIFTEKSQDCSTESGLYHQSHVTEK